VSFSPTHRLHRGLCLGALALLPALPPHLPLELRHQQSC
jgi:hypothetical protein